MEDYNKLESQIGDFGGMEDTTPQPPTNKKLKYKHTGKQDLDETEQESMERFVSRSRMRNSDDDMYTSSMGNSVEFGWVPIDKSRLGFRAQFYPEDWTFYVRPAPVASIKNWSAIDESRIDTVNEVFNEIIKSCVSIRSSSGNIPWSRINSWDRFSFILMVREYTFAKGESKIEFDDTCPECDAELRYTLTSDALYYDFPDDNIVTKHWNAVDRIWYINPKDYDLDAAPVKLYVPTLEKDAAILNWAINKTREKKQLNEVFLKFLPWMLPKAPKDEQVLDKFIKDCEMQFKSWDVDMFNFMDDVLRNIIVNPSENLRQVCPHCGEEVISNVKFPSGIKSLFTVQNKHRKFGSK